MNTQILKIALKAKKASDAVPSTPRGRALYTTDWFLNGRPVLRNHDNPCQTLVGGLVC